MRLVLIGAALLALPALMSTASAQKMPAAEPLKVEHPQFDERKYKAASQTVPEKKVDDPWAGAREPTPTAATTANSKPAPKRK